MPHGTNNERIGEHGGPESLEAEVIELRDYRSRQDRHRGDLSLWLLEVEQAHYRFGVMLERLRTILTS